MIVIINMLLLSISTSFFIMPVKADTSTNLQNAIDKANELKQNIADGIAPDANGINTIIKTLLLPAGFIAGTANFTVNQLRDIYSSIVDSNDTDEEALKKINDALGNSITVNDNSISYSSTTNTLINAYADAVKNNSGFYYAYSIRLTDNINNISDGQFYNALRQKLTELKDYNMIVMWYDGNLFATNDTTLSNINAGVVNYTNYTNVTNFYGSDTWQVKYITPENGVCYLYDATNHTYVSNNNTNWAMHGGGYGLEPGGGMIQTGYTYPMTITLDTYKTYKVYQTLEDLKHDSLGIAPYYQSKNYSNNINSGNTYDNSNSNNITYGDVTNYVNNYYGSNGNYPDTPVINIYIDNNIPDGGGSGGGGSGGIDDIGIFDFLSRIGAVIGNLIKNLGNILAELVEGISTVVSSLLESIPTVFNDFLGSILGWLPPELRALLTLAISAMVIVGLIKMFKG